MTWIFKSLLAAGIACSGIAAKADTVTEPPATRAAGIFISEYDNALAPLQFVKFCMNYGTECEPDKVAEQVLPSGERAQAMLREVNRSVNDSITPMQKPTSPLLAHWAVSPAAGDCNDYAVTKRHRLIEMGWPKSALRLAVVLTADGRGHLVLVARLSDGDVVLDNLSSSVRPWNAAGYQWISMQSGSNPRFWVAVGEHGEHLRASRLASLRTPL
ncbi:transglutaminase-like cysteine peptidase [Bradyrhizobium sp. 21]|uniref:transglutaminase-like cysteine peptidase n=1 Tax=Bradyrhizobium sp. 21 TaxID=2782666 RepID=UPI00211109E4|nr:transglutaminase-like cysteine peptidase [Bradyrhizobium sp. 21]MCK1384505.1 transglutaminase-like cysteine peptidase [Bradyrhizobium sp. 21]